MKTTFCRLEPKITCYKKCKRFSNDTFREFLLEVFSQVRISKNDVGPNNIFKIFYEIL